MDHPTCITADKALFSFKLHFVVFKLIAGAHYRKLNMCFVCALNIVSEDFRSVVPCYIFTSVMEFSLAFPPKSPLDLVCVMNQLPQIILSRVSVIWTLHVVFFHDSYQLSKILSSIFFLLAPSRKVLDSFMLIRVRSFSTSF